MQATDSRENVKTSVFLPRDQLAALRAFGERKRAPMSTVMRQAIDLGLAELERIERLLGRSD